MTDPLSVVAGVIAIATAAAKIGKAISRLRHFGEIPERLLALKNEVSDLEVVLRQVGHALEQHALAEDNEEGSLEQILSKAKDRLADLAKALERLANTFAKSKIKATTRSTVWWKEKELFESFHNDIRSIKQTLTLMLSAANSRDLHHIALDLRQVTVSTEKTLKSMALSYRMDQQYQDISQRLQAMSDAILSEGQPQPQPHPDSGNAIEGSEKGPESQLLRVLASNRTPCRTWCPCACHAKRDMKLLTPSPLESVLGRMFVGYSGLPVLSKRCDFRRCRDRQSASATVEYWFPWWFAATNIKLHLSRLPLIGPQLNVSVTRRIPDDSQAITFAMHGNVEGLQHMFSQRLVGPRDVSDSRGYTLMRWALYGGMHNFRTVQFLVAQGALVDDFSYDNVWDFLFRGKCNDREGQELRCITEHGDGDWVEEQNFPLVHKIIFGLSSKLLAVELDENPNAVYVTDVQHRTALDWATARTQLEDMSLLLKSGADPNNMDVTGRTPVLHAVDSHDAACLQLILEAGGNPNPVMPKGIFRSSPLTAAGFSGMTDLLNVLLDFEADPNATNPEGLTALHAVARTENVECALLLLEYGADLDALSANGGSPLKVAIVHNNHPVLRLFVNHYHDYATATLLNSTHHDLLPAIAGHADMETMDILASSRSSRISQDLGAASIAESQAILQRRLDRNEKLTEAFDELIAMAKNEDGRSQSVDSLMESGTFFKSSAASGSSIRPSRDGSPDASCLTSRCGNQNTISQRSVDINVRQQFDNNSAAQETSIDP